MKDNASDDPRDRRPVSATPAEGGVKRAITHISKNPLRIFAGKPWWWSLRNAERGTVSSIVLARRRVLAPRDMIAGREMGSSTLVVPFVADVSTCDVASSLIRRSSHASIAVPRDCSAPDVVFHLSFAC